MTRHLAKKGGCSMARKQSLGQECPRPGKSTGGLRKLGLERGLREGLRRGRRIILWQTWSPEWAKAIHSGADRGGEKEKWATMQRGKLWQ